MGWSQEVRGEEGWEASRQPAGKGPALVPHVPGPLWAHRPPHSSRCRWRAGWMRWWCRTTPRGRTTAASTRRVARGARVGGGGDGSGRARVAGALQRIHVCGDLPAEEEEGGEGGQQVEGTGAAACANPSRAAAARWEPRLACLCLRAADCWSVNCAACSRPRADSAGGSIRSDTTGGRSGLSGAL